MLVRRYTSVVTQSQRSLQARLTQFLAIGAGFGVAVVLLGSFAIWWSSRPKPWNSSAVLASVQKATDIVDDKGSPISITLTISFQNTTSRDYTLSPSEDVEIMFRTAQGLRHADGAKLSTPLFVPSGDRAIAHLDIPVDPLLELFIETHGGATATATHEAKRSESLFPSEVTSIVVFDRTNRYAIDLPRKW
jgi:hypothetical protein